MNGDEYDDRRLEVEISKKRDNWVVADKSEINREITTIYNSGQGFIQAIKYCRTETGFGLKEAKRYVEEVVGRR